MWKVKVGYDWEDTDDRWDERRTVRTIMGIDIEEYVTYDRLVVTVEATNEDETRIAEITYAGDEEELLENELGIDDDELMYIIETSSTVREAETRIEELMEDMEIGYRTPGREEV